MRLLCCLIAVFLVLGAMPRAYAQFLIPATSQPMIVSLESLLQDMVSPDELARWPEPAYTNRQVTSYDRRTMAPDQPGWWANEDFSHFVRSEENAGRTEQVMLDTEGPGALVRFWLTAGAPKGGTIRVYLDNSEQPTLRFTGFDLQTGGLNLPPALLYRHDSYSAEAGGSTLYLPIPYAKHCKVTWEEGPRVAQRYYHINYRTYPEGTAVTTWTPEQMNSARPLIERTARALEAPPQTTEGRLTSLNQRLVPQKPVTLALPAGSNAVRTLELLLGINTLATEEVERALRSVIVQMSFDGEQTVWCPATDFFGSGVGLNELRNFYQTVSKDGTLRCRWVMPYQKSARITLVNLGTSAIMATLHATTSSWQWDVRSMYFHANWHYEAGLSSIPSDKVMENTTVKDWNFVRVQGRGVYVGDSLSIFNPVATWYGEGDEKIFVDGEAFPSHMGTGTEDYYGYSYAPRPVFQHPLINHIRIDSPSTQGTNVMSRMRPLDSIPFQKSLRFDMELISWKPTTSTYAATTYWYALPGASSNEQPQPGDATMPVQTLARAINPPKLTPNAIEAETLTVVSHSPSFTPQSQDMSEWDGARWSSGQHLLGKATAVGDFLELEIPASDNAPRQIVFHATQAPDYAILRFQVNGQASNAQFDGYAPQVQPGPPINLGVFTPRNGRFLLRIEVSGANPKAQKGGTLFGLDYLELKIP